MAQASFAANLVCPERALFEGRAEAVSCRTSDGLLTVMALHAELVADVLPGVVTVESGGQSTTYVVHGGFLHVATSVGADPEHEGQGTMVTLLAGVAEPISAIDVPRAEAAKAAAEAELAQLAGSDDDAQHVARRRAVEADLARADLRLSVARH